MKKIFPIIAMIVMGCSPVQEKPEGLISTKAMIPLIVDLQLMEEHYQRLFGREDVYSVALDSASFYIFESHEVTKSQFEESYLYYSMNTDTLFAIYESALESINFRISNPNP